MQSSKRLSPRSLARPFAKASLAGFTLVELLVVFALLGLLAVVLVSHMRIEDVPLRFAAREVAVELAAHRDEAIRRNETIELTFDERTILRDGKVRYAAPDSVEIEVSPPPMAIRFFPDGSSSGAEITIVEGDKRELVSIDWVTGRIRVGDDDAR